MMNIRHVTKSGLVRMVVTFLGVVVTGGCGVSVAGPATTASSPSCTTSDTEAPLGKVWAMGDQYAGCHVKVAAVLAATTQNQCSFGGVPGVQDAVTFVVWSEGDAAPRSVMVPKSGADILFQIKKGESITMVGGTRPLIAGQYCFVADSVTRAGAPGK